ncbi:MAG TPA: helix-turn-helix transcriptional regulator [Gaiellaceae bacterium]|jgi:DNA-binding CsgD family transcriptional regulator|nr:helix-turn-helix transcriptional regulator [Gaiellaceae bacterium]
MGTVAEGALREPGPDLRRILSPRELEVLEMASLGLTNWQIAGRLHVTVHAVKFHLGAVYRKLGVTNRTEAAVLYLRAGAEPPHDAAASPRWT